MHNMRFATLIIPEGSLALSAFTLLHNISTIHLQNASLSELQLCTSSTLIVHPHSTPGSQ